MKNSVVFWKKEVSLHRKMHLQKIIAQNHFPFVIIIIAVVAIIILVLVTIPAILYVNYSYSDYH